MSASGIDSRAERVFEDVVAVEHHRPLYRWEEWLEHQLRKGLEHAEIADVCGVSRATITKWTGKYGLQQREYDKTEPYHYEEWLQEKYHEEGMTQQEIADLVGVGKSTISTYMDRHDIKTRSPYNVGVSHYIDQNGYERFESGYEGEQDHVMAHRLLAVAEHGFDSVCGMDVHHKNNIPWDNRPENIQLLTHAEHTALHNKVNYNE